MQNIHTSSKQVIKVVPYIPGQANIQPINIHLLRYWHNNSSIHPVNDMTVSIFLLHVQLFGVRVYPQYPQLGCLAINNNEMQDSNEISRVSQIIYKGELIWCRC